MLEERAICCDDVRVRATGAGAELPRSGELAGDPGPLPAPTCVTSAYFEACCRRRAHCLPLWCICSWLPGTVHAPVQAGGRQDTPVFVLRDLQPGHSVPGPAIVLDDISTVVIEPACSAHVTPAGDLRVDVGSATGPRQQTPTECDPIQLAIFSHRCASLHLMISRCCAETSHQKPVIFTIASAKNKQPRAGHQQPLSVQVHGHRGADGPCAAAHVHQR